MKGKIGRGSCAKLKAFAETQRPGVCSRLDGGKCGKDGPMDWACGSDIEPNKPVLRALDAFGRQRLSKHYFMRDFLYSEVAEVHGIANVPDNAELAITSGRALCRNLLEPLRHVFGHITIRSGFCSVNVNGYCNCHDMACSANKASRANHIWDHKDGDGFMGATVCIVIPEFVDWLEENPGRDWRILAWFIHDHLPYSEMVFFNRNGTVNLTWRGDPDDAAQDGDVRDFDGGSDSMVWRSEPRRRVLGRVEPRGLMFEDGTAKEGRPRSGHYVELLHCLCGGESGPGLADYLRELREAKGPEDDRFNNLVNEWKAGAAPKTFKKWRSEQVDRIDGAWRDSGERRCSFAERENRYRLKQSG